MQEAQEENVSFSMVEPCLAGGESKRKEGSGESLDGPPRGIAADKLVGRTSLNVSWAAFPIQSGFAGNAARLPSRTFPQGPE